MKHWSSTYWENAGFLVESPYLLLDDLSSGLCRGPEDAQPYRAVPCTTPVPGCLRPVRRASLWRARVPRAKSCRSLSLGPGFDPHERPRGKESPGRILGERPPAAHPQLIFGGGGNWHTPPRADTRRGPRGRYGNSSPGDRRGQRIGGEYGRALLAEDRWLRCLHRPKSVDAIGRWASRRPHVWYSSSSISHRSVTAAAR